MKNYSYLKSSAGDIVVFDAVTSRTLNYQSTVPEYPTEAGFNVSDAVLKGLPTFDIEAVLSGMSLISTPGSGMADMQSAAEMLQKFYFDAELLEFNPSVNLGKNYGRKVKNLIIESLSFPEESTFGKAYQVRITFKQMQFPVAATAVFYVTDDYDLGGTSRSASNGNVTPEDWLESTRSALMNAQKGASGGGGRF